MVDDNYIVAIGNEFDSSCKPLRLLLLPMESDTDSYSFKLKYGAGSHR